MIEIKRSVRIEWRNNPSSFETRNKEAFKTDFLRLGSAIRPVNELLSRSEEMRTLLPTVVGISPIDVNWQERITTYLHDFLLEIPIHGLVFDTSYVFDMGDPVKKKNIDALKAKYKDLPKDDSELEQYLCDKLSTLDETELYKYVTFKNIPDYIAWRYCLLSSKVANKVEDINKSVNIQFYLTSDSERKALQANRARLRTKAMTAYTTLVNGANKTKIDYIVISSNRLGTYSEFKGMNDDDKQALLLELCDADPKAFIELVNDKQLQMKSRLIIYNWMGLVRTLPNSSIIVDGNNPQIVIGNNINDAISYFSNELNKAYVSELDAKYRSLKQ